MKSATDYADRESALDFIGQLYPHAGSTVIIDHGYDNIVIIVDESYAVRFPRNTKAYLRNVYETIVLSKLQSITNPVLPVPLDSYLSPLAFVNRYVPGRHLNVDEIVSLPLSKKTELAEDFCNFVVDFQSRLSEKDIASAKEAAGLGDVQEEPWPDYFKRMISGKPFQSTDRQRVADSSYAKWMELVDVNNRQTVVHDDLHVGNLLFDNDNRLSGVLDFGLCDVGTVEQEFRQLARISEELLNIASEKYIKITGRPVDLEAAKLWAIMQDLAAYNKYVDGEGNPPGLVRARYYLNKWFPDVNW